MNSVPGKTIVIVDDEKSYVDLLAETLAEHVTNPVATFTRPFTALEALPKIDVGIIVKDYYMPQLNGLEFLLRARKLKPDIPFIVITGHGLHLSHEDLSHLPELKAVMYKPFGWRKLADEIVRCWPGADVPLIKTAALSN